MTEEPKAKRPSKNRAGDVQYTIAIPEAVGAAFAAWQAENGLTRRGAFLSALRAIGIPVTDADMEDGRSQGAATARLALAALRRETAGTK